VNSPPEYTYGYDVFKETFLERMERAKGEEYDDKGYIIEKKKKKKEEK